MNGCRTAVLALGLVCAAGSALAQDPNEPAAIADAFAAALAAGDEARVKQLLAPNVLIYEAGRQESSRDEYAAHHMKGDMALLATARRQALGRQQGMAGEMAWVATRSRLTGTHKDKPVDVFSTETLVLERAGGDWRIVHIQWSSRPVEPVKKGD